MIQGLIAGYVDGTDLKRFVAAVGGTFVCAGGDTVHGYGVIEDGKLQTVFGYDPQGDGDDHSLSAAYREVCKRGLQLAQPHQIHQVNAHPTGQWVVSGWSNLVACIPTPRG